MKKKLAVLTAAFAVALGAGFGVIQMVSGIDVYKRQLSGRSFVPLLIGFGCSVPAVMATRTLSSERDRKMTLLLIPFMSCSAKLPIYALFCAAFFPEQAALMRCV